jgi:hypothetical protein
MTGTWGLGALGFWEEISRCVYEPTPRLDLRSCPEALDPKALKPL